MHFICSYCGRISDSHDGGNEFHDLEDDTYDAYCVDCEDNLGLYELRRQGSDDKQDREYTRIKHHFIEGQDGIKNIEAWADSLDGSMSSTESKKVEINRLLEMGAKESIDYSRKDAQEALE